ncbi:MAG TPA: AmmeMemoRadiSam system protein B [Spirochaetes bacterium]|nr:AmmeMemoRadiSam system protein B [Spirochaetota bacterium]
MPFLQVVLPKFSLVPVIIGTTDLDLCAAIAGEIYEALISEQRKIAVIISTDLSHYHSYEEARSLDGVFIKLLESYDAVKLQSALAGDETQACGEGPVLCGMILSKSLGADRVEILKYANSGDTAGGRDQVVGYLSAAMTARE